MSRRTTVTTVIAAAASLVAFSLGTVSAPAGAGVARMTTDRVERIAARVVGEQAGSLSVAHADRADLARDARRLGGRRPAAFQATTYRVGAADLVTERGSNIAWTLDDVPAGRYLLSYDLRLDKSAADLLVGCSVGFTGAQRIEPSLAVAESRTSTVTGSGFIVFGGGRKLQLGCGVPSGTIAVSPSNYYQSSITLTEVESDRVSDVTAEVSTR